MNDNLRIGAVFSYLLSLFFISMGLYKMFAYENSDSVLRKSVNAYVGGDAYNYIINANYATAYFALAIFCAIIGMTFILSGLLLKDSAVSEVHNTTQVQS